MSLNIKNPNIFWSKKDLDDAWKSMENYTDILSIKPSRSESQMKLSLRKVMKYLYKNKAINETSIHKGAPINWPSLVRSLRFLLTKQIVSVKQHNDKQNNEKIYSLNRNRAVVYGDHLINYKMNLFNWKKQRVIIKENYKRLEKSPEKFLDWWMYFTAETAKKKGIRYSLVKDFFSKKENKTENKGAYIQIKSLSNKEIDIIFRDFCNLHYCINCYEKSKKTSLKKRNESRVEEYQRRYGDPKQTRIKYGVDANKFKTPLLTEVKEKGGFPQCTRCGGDLEKFYDEGPARQIGTRRKYDLRTIESNFESYSDLVRKQKKFNRV